MLMVPHPNILPFIGCEEAPKAQPMNLCQTLYDMHVKALSKLAQVRIEAVDEYTIAGRKTMKPELVKMLESHVMWTSEMFFNSGCGGPQIASARPAQCGQCRLDRDYDVEGRM